MKKSEITANMTFVQSCVWIFVVVTQMRTRTLQKEKNFCCSVSKETIIKRFKITIFYLQKMNE